MSTTPPDVDVSNDEFTDVLSSSGLSGTVVVQNKSNNLVQVVFAAAKPANDETRGFILTPYDAIKISGESNIWCRGNALVSVSQGS